MACNKQVVLIATAHRIPSLIQTLQSIGACVHLDRVAKIVIVNNGTLSQTSEIEEWLRSHSTVGYTVLHESRTGKSPALNLGLNYIERHFDGATQIVFTDDDVTMEPLWLDALFKGQMKWGNKAILAGKITPSFPSTVPDFIPYDNKPLMTMLYAEYNHQQPEGPILLAPFGPNMAVMKDLINGVRFDERLGPPNSVGEEYLFCLTLKGLGGEFIYLPDAMAGHRVREEQLGLTWILKRARMFGAAEPILYLRQNKPSLTEAIRHVMNAYSEALSYAVKTGLTGLIAQKKLSLYYRFKLNRAIAEGEEWGRVILSRELGSQ